MSCTQRDIVHLFRFDLRDFRANKKAFLEKPVRTINEFPLRESGRIKEEKAKEGISEIDLNTANYRRAELRVA